MTIAPSPIIISPHPVRRGARGSVFLDLLRTTDHKTIGKMYLVTAFGFFLAGGVMALLMRGELARPGLQFLSLEQYNQLFTMHGTIMLLLFATPMLFAFANLVLPLQIGAPDVSFPRLNALSYWLFLFGGLTVMSGFATPGGAADFGWYAYTPLSDATNSPGVGGDLWIVGLALSGLGTILGAVNMITTVVTLRAPGMTMFRMPIFTWNILITSVMVLLAFPILTAALFALLADRKFGAQIFEPSNGGAILWQHLFWFFGHPEVYIVALPFFGIVTEVIPVFSRKPLFGYKGMVGATIAIMALSMTVWAHHMFATGAVLLPFFSFMSYLIAIPTGIKFFNWIGTMWRGSISFETPMLWSIGFLVTFLLGGLTGVILASPPLDFHLNDSYFLVAHFHYVLFGTIVFAVFSGIYFWFPKFTGRYLDERLGKLHFWGTFIGFHDDLPGAALARRRGHAPPVRRLPAQRRVHHPQHGVHDRRVPARHLDPAVPVERLPVVQVRRGRRPPTTRGATATRWSGRPPARRRGTTSPSCRGSARSGRRSRRTTRSWPSGSRWRPTPAAARSAPRTLPEQTPASGGAPRIPTRADTPRHAPSVTTPGRYSVTLSGRSLKRTALCAAMRSAVVARYRQRSRCYLTGRAPDIWPGARAPC